MAVQALTELGRNSSIHRIEGTFVKNGALPRIEKRARWIAGGAAVLLVIGVFVLRPAAERLGVIGDRAIDDATWYRVYSPDGSSTEAQLYLPFSTREDCEDNRQLNREPLHGRLSGCVIGAELKAAAHH